METEPTLEQMDYLADRLFDGLKTKITVRGIPDIARPCHLSFVGETSLYAQFPVRVEQEALAVLDELKSLGFVVKQANFADRLDVVLEVTGTVADNVRGQCQREG